jgi:hypothetical protein
MRQPKKPDPKAAMELALNISRVYLSRSLTPSLATLR